ncbi:hypothetical protein OI25_3909 [Paraburkholderia fungorum]|uniref:Uncharacterized protein n=1 Tax=Paraburkholderia fungorum TaxID=134537 RepID=A0AAU8T826_9BURK|nr:hypothetical protein OI25_3909 [Paraburkholderia fungorum]
MTQEDPSVRHFLSFQARPRSIPTRGRSFFTRQPHSRVPPSQPGHGERRWACDLERSRKTRLLVWHCCSPRSVFTPMQAMRRSFASASILLTRRSSRGHRPDNWSVSTSTSAMKYAPAERQMRVGRNGVRRHQPGAPGRKFEAILSAMSITPQREARVAFSTSLFITGCTSMAIPAMHSARRSAVLSSRSCRLTATGARSHGGARARYGSARLQRCRRFTQLRQPGDRPYRQRLNGSDPDSFPVAPESWLYMLSIKK